MSQSIADVYAVRSDWFRQNKALVEKIVAGYLLATEEVVGMRDEFESSKRMSPKYRSVLSMAQSIFGKDVLPTLELDAHGLLLDCRFARLPGQIAFFSGYVDAQGVRRTNPNGFEAKMNAALDLASGWGYAESGNRFGFDPPGFDYRQLASLATLKYVEPKLEGRFDNVAVRGGELTVGEGGVGAVEIDANTIFSFEITYPPNEREFYIDRYGAEFRRAIESSSTFGDAVVVIRGHSDPSLTLINLLKAGLKQNVLKRVGGKYYHRGRPLDLSRTEEIVELINRGGIKGDDDADPRVTMQAALNLSHDRANTVKDVIVNLAAEQGVSLDVTQLQPIGVGIAEPVVPVPKSVDDAAPNRRVEFRIVKIPSEAIKKEDFDLLGGQ
jgi:hypothetical protein